MSIPIDIDAGEYVFYCSSVDSGSVIRLIAQFLKENNLTNTFLALQVVVFKFVTHILQERDSNFVEHC
mgnify:CR=1 FL=1